MEKWIRALNTNRPAQEEDAILESERICDTS